jgi:uncharacterized protein (TIGR02466 family)
MNITNVDPDTVIYNPFPSFVYRTKLDIDIEKLTDKIESLVDRKIDWTLWLSHWTHPNLVEVDPIFKDVSDQLAFHANKFYCLSKNIDRHLNLMKVKRLWFNVYKHGGYMRAHDHYESYYASSLYLKTNKSSKITFTHPSQIKFNTTVELDPQPGELLIWPGWMLHEVSPNLEVNTERVVLSAKIDYVVPHTTLDGRRLDTDLLDNF